MRLEDIRFKAKRLDNNEWVIGDLLHSYEGGAIIVPITEVGQQGGAFSVDPSTVCQYTGLKDSKGNEIWEHDIITEGDDIVKYEIIWHPTLCCFALKDVLSGLWGTTTIGYPELLNFDKVVVLKSKFDKEV